MAALCDLLVSLVDVDDALAQVELGLVLVVDSFQLEQRGVFLLDALTAFETSEDGADVQATSVRLSASSNSFRHDENLKAYSSEIKERKGKNTRGKKKAFGTRKFVGEFERKMLFMPKVLLRKRLGLKSTKKEDIQAS
jgi:hypothetical protein